MVGDGKNSSMKLAFVDLWVLYSCSVERVFPDLPAGDKKRGAYRRFQEVGGGVNRFTCMHQLKRGVLISCSCCFCICIYVKQIGFHVQHTFRM